MRHVLFTVLMTVAPRAALACPVCFGQNDSAMGNAIQLGVILMLGVVAVVLTGFASFIVHLTRRARLFAVDVPGLADGGRAVGPPADPASHVFPGADLQEGNARC